MPKSLTKAQLTDELVRLRAHCDHIEGKLASWQMARAREELLHDAQANIDAVAFVRPKIATYTTRDGRTFEKHVTYLGSRVVTRHVLVN